MAVGLIALAGCAGAPPAPAKTIVVTVTPTADPKPAAPTPSPLPDIDVQIATAPPPSPNAPAPVIEPGPATDNGAVAGAMGPAVSDANGQLLSYTVVSGDSFFEIAQRFDLPQQQLLRMNPQIHDLGETIYIGMVINLDWTKTG
ncbi:LysM peptidoglycan-binding domain-containing protein [Rathayibacter sp. YIM 133350]|uniref:LysM peptidoglycan-binding domain-containing protein n=1 Tax=Rathayibacter sp. YIM 133350 TaxID=3131992 RepID=UPI00307E5E7E